MPKVKVRVTLNRAAAVARIKAANADALTAAGNQALKDVTKHVPKDQGTLQSSGLSHSDKRAKEGRFVLRWSTPYACLLYTSILERNNFRVRGNQLVELAFALGTGAFVEYLDADGNVIIDYIRADMIYPLSWDNGDITECAFGSVRVLDGKETVYLQIHRKGRAAEELGEEEAPEDPELYYIENRYICLLYTSRCV